ncbi:MAG: hypothetical protein IJR85_01720 [Synergistaceae bacterium]|nr:hypothetical protein [Synergistaceae bacterium]
MSYEDGMGFSPGIGANFRVNEAKYLTNEGRRILPAGRYIMQNMQKTITFTLPDELNLNCSHSCS